MGEAPRAQPVVDSLIVDAEHAVVRCDFNAAERHCAQILSAEPSHHKAGILLALAQANTGRLELARHTLEALLERNPACPIALNWLAAVLRALGEYGLSIETCLRIVKVAPRDAESRNNLGLCYIMAGHFQEAAESFHEAERLDPTQPRYYENAAIALQRCGLVAEAEDACRRGLACFPDDAALNAGLGALLFEKEEHAASIPFLRQALARQPEKEEYKISLAQATALCDSFDESEKLAREVLAANPRNARAHAIVGSVLQHRGDFGKSGAHLKTAIDLDPCLVGAYFEYIYGGRFRRENEYMLRALESLLEEGAIGDHDRLCLLYALGKAYDDLGEYASAMRFFEDANRLALCTRRKNREFRAGAFEHKIRRLVERFGADYFDSIGQGLQSAKPVFIIGMMRSGSTLLEQVLSSHPQVAAGGELMFWPDAMKRDLSETDSAVAAGNEYLSYLGKIAPKAPRVTDKMLDNVLHVPTLASIFPEAKFICCRRHPVGTCLSLFTTPFRYAQPYLHDKDDIAAACRIYTRLMNHWRDVMPAHRFMEVWYKDLIGDKEATARKLVDFCGLEWDDACLKHESNGRIVTTASKWQARQPVYRDSIEKWQHYLPWIEEFLEIADEARAAA